jgi:predicted esterase
MIEHIPKKVRSAFIYLHSAGVGSKELSPFLPKLIEDLPSTYIWAGDGVISGSPLMYNGAYYGDCDKRYWFMFPMQDASTPKSFQQHSEAMGASLLSSGAFLNSFVDRIMERFSLPTNKIVLSGFQHGSCLALAASMMRKTNPYRFTILFEPYILEGYYLEKESIQAETNVVCIENQYMRNRVKNWINIETDKEFKKFGMNVTSIVLDGEEEKIDAMMINEAVKIVQRL